MLTAIRKKTRTDSFLDWMGELLLALCEVDTTPNSNLEIMRANEDRLFGILEAELKELFLPDASLRRLSMNPAISDHPAYTPPYYTISDERPEGLDPQVVFRDRGNLVYLVGGTSAAGNGLALNAHVDVVAPFFPPFREGTRIIGRGACDDKGPVALIVAALKVLSEILQERKANLVEDLVCMFPIEEETGGNGSLSLTLDRELKKRYGSVLVVEATENRVHPANRGAVWYKTVMSLPGANLLELAAFVVEEIEKEGRSIRSESRHELFPSRPVQTSHGIIGGFGEHPSRICGRVDFRIRAEQTPDEDAMDLITDVLDFAVQGYCGQYGDKSQETDPVAGEIKVPRHYDLVMNPPRESSGGQGGAEITVRVFGRAGHMGSLFENDNAITKTAWMVRGLVYSRNKITAAAGPFELRIAEGIKEGGANPEATSGQAASDRLILEGGQGFVPTHGLAEVTSRLEAAVLRGAESYLRREGIAADPAADADKAVTTTFRKLHNEAYETDPDSAAVHDAVHCLELSSMRADEPVLGWNVSSDARLFAHTFPGMPVVVCGPGSIGFAHSDEEQIDLEEMRRFVEFLILYILRQTETFPGEI